MIRAIRIAAAIALVILYAASLAGDGMFTDAQVFALPWYGAAYHMIKTVVSGLWAGAVLAEVAHGKAGEP